MIRNYMQAFTCTDKNGFKRFLALKPGVTNTERDSKRYQDNLRDMKELMNNAGMTKKLGVDLKTFGAPTIKKLDIKYEIIDYFDTPDVLNSKPESAILKRIPKDLFLKNDGKWKEFCKNDALVFDAFKSVKNGMLKFEPIFKEFEDFILDVTKNVNIIKEADDVLQSDNIIELPVADIFNLSLDEEKKKAIITLIGYENLQLKPDQRKWSFSFNTKGRVRFQVGGVVAKNIFKSHKYRIDLDCFKTNKRHESIIEEIKKIRIATRNSVSDGKLP